MMLPVLAALTGRAEARLVAELAEKSDRVVVARRPADIVELVAAAEAGIGRAALIAEDFVGFDIEVVTRLHTAGVRSVAMSSDRDRLSALGVDAVVEPDADVEHVIAALLAGAPSEPGTGWDRIASRGRRAAQSSAVNDEVSKDRGAAVITAWGTGGAPGRTTVAVNLAAHMAAAGRATLLIDADTCGAAIAASLGLLDESAGLATVCRLAGRGTLDVADLNHAMATVAPRLTVLTGIAQSNRWPEISGPRLDRVFEIAKRAADVVIIDCAAPIEQDEELSYDTDAPRRNAATLAAIAAADRTPLVGSADPIGLQRFVRAHDDVREQIGIDPFPVVNKLRPAVVGTPAGARVAEALDRFAGLSAVTMLPADHAACDAALLRGVALGDHSPRSPLTKALGDLAGDLASRLDIKAPARPPHRRRTRRSKSGQ